MLVVPGHVARSLDLRRAGTPRRAIGRAVEQGVLRRVARGIVAAGEAGPYEAERAMALSRAAVLSHASAALAWGIELLDPPTAVHLIRPRVTSAPARPSQVHRMALAATERAAYLGAEVTTVRRTLVDLARTLPFEAAVASCDSALRQGLVDPHVLAAYGAEMPPAAGRPRVQAVFAAADPGCGSVLESRLRLLLISAGLTPERTQLRVRSPRNNDLIGRVDFAWPSAALIVEADGFGFHADREAYRKDRRRDNALKVAGWSVLRFSFEDVVRSPDYVVATVRALLARAA